MSLSKIRVAWIASLLVTVPLLAVTAAAAQPVAGPVHDAGFIGYLQQQTVSLEPFTRWKGLRVKRLHEDPSTGRLAVLAEIPAGWRLRRAPVSMQSLDIVMLDGELSFGASVLRRYDFAFVPPAGQAPPMQARRVSHALLFFDPPAADAEAVARQQQRGSYVTVYSDDRWQPASLAKSAGANVDLRVQNLKKDPFTSARTWYVKLTGGMTLPWEVHSMVEEGYVMRGDYVLAECLKAGTVIGDYQEGGYFWRPGGIPHSGPDSGTRNGVMWLQRSDIALDVTFFNRCESGSAADPIAR